MYLCDHRLPSISQPVPASHSYVLPMPITNLLNLPDDCIHALCAHHRMTAYMLGRLVSCCHRLHDSVDGTFVSRCGAARGEPGVVSLQQLAVLESLSNISTTPSLLHIRVTFEGVSTDIRTASQAKLLDVAAIMRAPDPDSNSRALPRWSLDSPSLGSAAERRTLESRLCRAASENDAGH